VAGLTYNLVNPSTNYQNGVDFHLDWGASKFLSKQLFVGPVGYFYDQLTCDSGSGDRVGFFKSRVVAIGPQIGYLFPIGNMQGYLNLKGYGEFDQQNRPAGWNAWLTFAISPAAPPAPTPTSRAPMVYNDTTQSANRLFVLLTSALSALAWRRRPWRDLARIARG
jgi:hypothetical protein